MKLGKEERYLKDDNEREHFMLSQALQGATLYASQGAAPIQGDALERIARSYLLAEAVIQRLSRIIDERALHALLNGLQLDMSDGEHAGASAAALRAALGNGETRVHERYLEKHERWQLVVEHIHHGNVKTSVIDDDFLKSGDCDQIRETSQILQGLIGQGASVERGDRQHAVSDFGDAMRWLLHEVEDKASVQRYKGLGEMNPEQLWETTMDPASRRLLKVQIEDGIAADEIFTKLMGDEVEPRREFIERNALIAQLDV